VTKRKLGTSDHEAGAAYFAIAPRIRDGQAVRQDVHEIEGVGEIVLDFDKKGRLLAIAAEARDIGAGQAHRVDVREVLTLRGQARLWRGLAPNLSCWTSLCGGHLGHHLAKAGFLLCGLAAPEFSGGGSL
jgi:hypothetical protein